MGLHNVFYSFFYRYLIPIGTKKEFVFHYYCFTIPLGDLPTAGRLNTYRKSFPYQVKSRGDVILGIDSPKKIAAIQIHLMGRNTLFNFPIFNLFTGVNSKIIPAE
jgi:hypothetical protein